MKQALIWLPILCSLAAHAEPLIHLQSGTQVQTEELLAKRKTLVFIEKDCTACLSYVRALESCEPALRDSIVLVSVSTAAQTKSLSRALPKSFPLYLAKDRGSIKATPTTQTGQNSKIGKISCDELAGLQKQSG